MRNPTLGKSSLFLKQVKLHKQLLFMLLPTLIYLIIFHYVAIYGIVIAFKDFQLSNGILGSPWVGFTHFDEVFSDSNFKNALKNTIFISLKLIQTVSFLPGSIIYLAALAGVDQTLYEAAYMDGANRIHRMLYILPSISNAIIILLILSMAGILDEGVTRYLNCRIQWSFINPKLFIRSESLYPSAIYPKESFQL